MTPSRLGATEVRFGLLLVAGWTAALAPVLAANLWPPLEDLQWCGLALFVAAVAVSVLWIWPRQKNGLLYIATLAMLAASIAAMLPLGKLLITAFHQAAETQNAAVSGLAVFRLFTKSFAAHVAYNGPYAATWAVAAAVCFVLFLFTASRLGGDQRHASKSAPWQGGFLSGDGLQNLVGAKKGLPLGLLNKRIVRYAPGDKTGFQEGHSALLAGTRGGKGVACILPAIVEHQGPVFATDIKGELIAITCEYRRSLGRKVVALNPFFLCGVHSGYFNPLDWIRDAEIVADSAVIADGLIQPEKDSGQHFSDMARLVTAAAIEATVNTTTRGDKIRNLVTVADLVQSAEWMKTFSQWAQAPEKFGDNAAKAGALMLQADEKEVGFIRSTIGKNFQWLADKRVRRMVGKSSFDLNELIDDELDLFICVPLQMIKQQAVFLRLMTNLTVDTVLRQNGRRTVKAPIFACLDEFTRLGRMEKLIDVATVAAGAGVHAMFVAQNVDAIQAVYGKEDANTLLASCATIRVFNLGRGDVETAQWAEKQLPEKTVVTESRSSGLSKAPRGHQTATNSSSTNEQRQKIMTAPQILEMPSHQILCLIRSHPALLLNKIISHKHPAYRKKLSPNPTRVGQ